MLRTCLLFVTVKMSSVYQTSVNYRSRKVKGNIKHHYRYYSYFPGLNLYSYLKKLKASLFTDEERAEFLSTSLLLGNLDWNWWLGMLLHPR
jgi:hypothetical protein